MTHFRISLSTMLLLAMVVALSIALAHSRLRVSRLKGEIQSLTPVRELGIVAQVEALTASAGTPAVVESLAYNGNGPSYRIAIAYHAEESGVRQSASVLLTHQGNGKYSGRLRVGPYLRNEPDENGEWGTEIVVWDQEIVDALNPAKRAGGARDGGA